jgi:monoamine oxidase
VGAAAAGLGLAACDRGEALLDLAPRASRALDTGTSVAIVGAGLAGLTCGWRLRQAGIAATVYEASTRLGGRCWTRRGDVAAGQIAEHGGELIDQSHKHIRQLAQEPSRARQRWPRRPAARALLLLRRRAVQLRDATCDIKQIGPPRRDLMRRATAVDSSRPWRAARPHVNRAGSTPVPGGAARDWVSRSTSLTSSNSVPRSLTRARSTALPARLLGQDSSAFGLSTRSTAAATT